jgi:hypothetical protein
MERFPLPGSAPAAAPGRGPQFWAGAPSAVLDGDGTYVVGYEARLLDESHELRTELVV